MSRPNLLKSVYVSIDNSQVRVIDSNDRVRRSMGEEPVESEFAQEAKPYEMQSFSEDTEDDTVARLFGEEPSEGLHNTGSEAARAQMEGGELSAASLDEQTQQMAQQILDDANAQAAQIIERAQDLAAQQAREAYQNAHQQGMQDGYQDGFQKAQSELENAKAQLAQKEEQLRGQFAEKLDDMEPFLVEELTGIYEHIFDVDLSEHRSVLAHLIANTLHGVENVDSYLVHVSSQDYSYVSMQKPQLIEDGCTGNASVEIIEDMTLSKNECLIETENGIFDCSLSVQLGELKRKLKLLSYRGNKE